MATIKYTGSVSEAMGLNDSPSVSLSGSGEASGIINSVTALLTFSTNAYGNYYNVTATLRYSGGSKSTSSTVKMDSSNYTSGQFPFTFTGLTASQANSISSISVTCDSNASKIFLKGSQTVTVDYTTISSVSAPNRVIVSATDVAPGASVTLSWTGAAPGENCAIAGYRVYRSTDSNGDYTLLDTVTTSVSYGSVTVTAPTTANSSYYYKVQTLGTLSGYDSAQSDTYATLTCTVDACTAPTTLEVSNERVAPGVSVTLSWVGAAAGANNTISGYKVYRATSSSGIYSLLTSVSTTATSGSTSVTAPETKGSSYYYKVQTIGARSGYDSEQSSSYATLTCSYDTCSAPSTLTLSAESVAPGTKVRLSWSGAKSGENNAITGYRVYRSNSQNGEYNLLTSVSTTTTSGNTMVAAPTTNGSSYYYRVQTVGTLSGGDSDRSSSSVALTCSFESVGAPNSVSLAATNASPGAEVTLTWSGATGGDNNAITGYQVYRSESDAGEYNLLTSVSTAATSGSVTVVAPTANNATYYYRVLTLGTLSGSSSALSSVYAALTCTFSTPSAPSKVTIAGGASAYAAPGSTVLLSWSGAAAGANNAITGYTVYRDGAEYSAKLAPSVSQINVPSHGTTGKSYSYTVVTLGTHSNSAPSVARVVYSYTDPTAPTSVTVSDDTPTTGERVTLSWSGAKAGGYNDIVGYRVYRSASTSGARTQVAYVSVTTSHGSCYVSAPANVGGRYYFWVETIGAYSVSALSSKYASVYADKEKEAEGADTVVIVPPPTKRKKRGFIFGDYDTAVYGWTLTGWEFPEPEAQTSYVTIPGRMKGPLDLTTALTDGDPRYGSRELTAIFENSEGTRLERDEIISAMTNLLHGREEEIIFPDDPSRYAVGRLSVRLNYSDVAHAEVSVQAVCEPWRYNQQETQVRLMATEDEKSAVLSNAGRCILVPEVHVLGAGSHVRLGSGDNSWTLAEGVYRLPDLALRKGNTFIKYSGIGTLMFKYREAIL